MRNVLIAVTGLLTFFMGLKLGQQDAGSLGCLGRTSSGGLGKQSLGIQAAGASVGGLKAEPCSVEVVTGSKGQGTWFPDRPGKPVKSCPALDNYGSVFVHTQKTKKKLGSVMDSVVNKGFEVLHHPPNPSNAEFIVSQGRKIESYDDCTEIYMTRSGSRASMPNKCVAVLYIDREKVSPWMQSHRYGIQAKMVDKYTDDFLEKVNYPDEVEGLPPLLHGYDPSIVQFRNLLGSPLKEDGNRRTVIVMVANEGVIDLVLNFLCSCREKAAGIDISSIVVFLGQPEYVSLINNMGARGVYNDFLGKIPKKAAGNYGDKTFGKLMWLKTTSVYIALTAGFDVIFQDADVVWLKDPVPHLQSVVRDVAFMDDGARTPRFTPYFVNSGFYYFKNTPKVKYLMERMLKSGPGEISVSHSHQSVLIRYLTEAHDLYGMDVNVLSSTSFPSGAMYHQNKSFINRIKKYQEEPYVFHMCWTANREDKVKYLKDLGMWYLPDQDPIKKTCEMPKLMRSWLESKQAKKQNILNYCCMAGDYWVHKPGGAIGTGGDGGRLRGT